MVRTPPRGDTAAVTLLGMSLPPRLAALAAAQGGPFTTAQAFAAGYDERAIYRLIRSGSWVRLRRGVYAVRFVVPQDVEGRHLLQLRAVLLCLKNPVVASHVTSAVLHQIAMLDPDYSLVHITRDCAGSSRAEAGVHHHDAGLPGGQLTKVDSLLTTTAARTVLDIARGARFEAGLIATESALNKKLTTLAELREILAYCTDWPGARDASRVVAFASPYSESPGESVARIAIDAVGLPPPSQQVEIYDALGFIARSDFLWKEHHTAAEFDGRGKYVGDDPEVLYKEKRREDRLRAAGVEVFRIDWAECMGRSQSIRRKALAAFERAARSGSRPTLRIKERSDDE
jgi:hypothetical protein